MEWETSGVGGVWAARKVLSISSFLFSGKEKV
jgi:hypothetical protein